jgi:glycine cleavage system H protein
MANEEEFIPFMGYEWIQIESGTVTVGISEEGLNELGDITAINLPAENEDVNPDEICGEIETDEGPMNLYSPVEGKIIEINQAVVENPSLLLEDPYGDGWLFRVEAEDADDLEDIDEDEDDDDDEDEDEEDDD